MASCENCHTRGIKADDIRVHEFPDGEKILIGPCCVGAKVRMQPELNYHLELSSQNGFVATVEYGGLKIEYKKSPEQLQEVFSKTEQPAVH